MPNGVKIATCCYCGTRAALRLTGRDRHELSCTACGAPLQRMKRMPLDHGGHAAPTRHGPDPRAVPSRPRPGKRRRKSPWHKALEEVWDTIEDIFD